MHFTKQFGTKKTCSLYTVQYYILHICLRLDWWGEEDGPVAVLTQMGKIVLGVHSHFLT